MVKFIFVSCRNKKMGIMFVFKCKFNGLLFYLVNFIRSVFKFCIKLDGFFKFFCFDSVVWLNNMFIYWLNSFLFWVFVSSFIKLCLGLSLKWYFMFGMVCFVVCISFIICVVMLLLFVMMIVGEFVKWWVNLMFIILLLSVVLVCLRIFLICFFVFFCVFLDFLFFKLFKFKFFFVIEINCFLLNLVRWDINYLLMCLFINSILIFFLWKILRWGLDLVVCKLFVVI